MKRRERSLRSVSQDGFTLLEVMVALIIGTVMVGGVMGLISVSLQYHQRLNAKAMVQPLLEAAAQEILAHPEKAGDGSIALKDFPDAPPVAVHAVQVPSSDDKKVQTSRAGQLYRIQLECRGYALEFSLIVPETQDH